MRLSTLHIRSSPDLRPIRWPGVQAGRQTRYFPAAQLLVYDSQIFNEKSSGAPMTQTSNRLLDEFAKLMTDATGMAQGATREVQSLVRSQGERILREMDVVQREEFEAVKAMAEKARAENALLQARIARLESLLLPAAPV